MQDVSHFRARLRELRKEAGLSQAALAEKAGLAQATIAQWETGRKEPLWANVIALARALGIPSTDFEQPSEGDGKVRRGRPRVKV